VFSAGDEASFPEPAAEIHHELAPQLAGRAAAEETENYFHCICRGVLPCEPA